MRGCRLAVALSVLLIASRVAGAQANDSTGSIVGAVVARDLGIPLPYSVVSVPASGLERFTNERGEFTLSGLPASHVRLVVRHIGYSPATVTVDVHAGRTDSVR